MDKIQLYTLLWLFNHTFMHLTYKNRPVRGWPIYLIKAFTFLPIFGRLFGWW